MMTPAQIINGMKQKNRSLESKVDEFAELSEKRAQAERAYHIAYAGKVVELKAAGTPVTIISALVKGDSTVAGLKYDLDVAEGVYKANIKAMDALNTAIDTYRSALSWLKTGERNAGAGQ